MVVTRIRQAGSLKPQVKVRGLCIGQAEMPPQSERWSLQTDPLYIRGANLWCLTAPLATLLKVEFPGLKIAPKDITPHTLHKVLSGHLSVPPAPHFPGFPPLSKKFLKIFSPRAPGTVRRALNCRTAPSRHSKPPEFRGKTAHPRPTFAPKDTRKTPSRSPEKPAPHTASRKKVE